jgi:hypothetical protein
LYRVNWLYCFKHDGRNAVVVRRVNETAWLGMGELRILLECDHLCGLVVRVSGYRSRGPGFGSRSYQIFWEVGGLEWVPLSLVRTTEELLEWKNNGSGLENRD